MWGTAVVLGVILSVGADGPGSDPQAPAPRVSAGSEASDLRMDENYPVDVLRRSAEISASTLSPFCPGKTLASCPSGKASAWRKDIRAMVADGMDETQIRQTLQQRTPDFELSAVPKSALSWWGPVAVLSLATAWLVGVGLVVARRRRREAPKSRSEAPDGTGADATDHAILQQELKQLD